MPAGDGGRAAERAESTGQLLGDIAKTRVYGAFVTLRREGRLRSCCGHLGPAVSLGDALDHAADRAATDDPRFPPIARSELTQLDVDVWVLWGPEPVTARGEDRVAAVVIGKHGLLIERGYNRGLLLPGVAVDHGFDAKTFLQQVCVKAGLPTDAWKRDDTSLMVFEGQAIEGRMADVCPPGGEDDVRPAAVAGKFYPGTPREVQSELDDLFASLPAVAAAAVGRARWRRTPAGSIRASLPRPSSAESPFPNARSFFARTTIGRGARWAVAPHRRWLFPGGELASDPDLAARLADGVEGLELDAEAHRGGTRHRGAVADAGAGGPASSRGGHHGRRQLRCRSCCGSAWRCRSCSATCRNGRCWWFQAT